MKLKENCITHQVDDEYLMLFTAETPDDFNGILRSDETAQFIVECLSEETTKEEILAKMQDEYEGDPAQMEKDIDMVLENLRTVGALEE